MYLDPASSTASSSAMPVEPANDADLKRRLWTQVIAAFPALDASSVRLEESGGDHLLLIVDEVRAVRFPRPEKHGMDLEISVLSQLRPQTQIALPAYDVVDPDGRFAGYPLIAGIALTRARFAALPGDAGLALLADVVALLKLLHGVDPGAIKPVERWPRMWSADQFADRIESRRLALLASRFPAIAKLISAFLPHYRADRAPADVVLHGDLVGDHMLIDEVTGKLTGIIDFGDVALGDPAHDLFGFWAYGTNAAAHAAKFYDPCDADPGLLARSRNHFIRYHIDRFYETVVDGAPDQTLKPQVDMLIGLIASSFQPIALKETIMADPIFNDTDSIDRSPADRPNAATGAAMQDATAVAGQAKRQAYSLLDQAKDKVVTVASTQKDGLATQLQEFAQSVHKSGEQFAGQQEWIAEAIERGASELNTLAALLRDNDLPSLAKEVKSVAQRRPALFAGICLAGGLALARVGKLVAADLSREDLPSLPEVGHGGQ